jgi:DNA-binding response OmpR family regulator
LRKEGFQVFSATSGEKALEKILKNDFSLIILDLMLPGMQGTEVCRMLRNNPKTEHLPIIMVTAKGDEVDRIVGLELGADDYIAKPFSPRELVARVKALLRRTTKKTVEENIITFGDLTINKDSYTVTKDNTPLHLSAIEFRLLIYLIDRKGRVFSRDQLLDAIWSNEVFVEPRTVDVHIRRLRTQIEDDASNPKYIKTKRGIGYYANPEL